MFNQNPDLLPMTTPKDWIWSPGFVANFVAVVFSNLQVSLTKCISLKKCLIFIFYFTETQRDIIANDTVHNNRFDYAVSVDPDLELSNG